ncbi:MAG: pentapeptide repeat-containing protein [Calothrix sp. SM1_7_51]|nr:pentapeptide repeat-containing protein [Calothrix sp. SM1_7_51]
MKLQNAKLWNANLSSANLNDVNFSGANLNGANLSNATLIRAKLGGAHLNNAKLNGAKFVGADLNKTDLGGVNNLNEAIFGCRTEFNNKGEIDKTYCTNLKGAYNITPEKIKKVVGWESACYDPGFRKELGLPPENLNNCAGEYKKSKHPSDET